MDDLVALASDEQDEEARLVAGLRAGDESAFDWVVRQFSPRMLSALRRILQNEEDARDALQEAFLSAFKALPRFSGQSRFSTWLHRIAINAALMKQRSRQRKRERPISDLLPKFLDDGHQAEPAAPWEPPETVLVRQEVRDLVRQSIDELPESYRTVLLLRDIEGLDTEQTADELGVSVSVVKTRLHRARQALKTLLDPHLRGGGA
jgi:RNA polymerase sigma-70 factor (ECF subfamily)